MMDKGIKAVCFGEVLWDVFPDKARIGGAPLNVASRLSSLGVQTEMISSVGNDERGKEIISYLQEKNISTRNIGIKEEYQTGLVNVSLSESGSATYEITYPAAWDKIEVSDAMKSSVSDSNVFIFGSLVCRDEISRNTLFDLLKVAEYKVFDINLRPPYFEKNSLIALMDKADFIKFNDDELFEIAEMLDSKYNSLEQNLHFIADKTNTKSVCVTKGRHGAVLLNNGKCYYNSGFKIKVKDTVGAGDSFLASLISGLFREKDPQYSLDFACAMGALVAAEEGANPVIPNAKIREFMNG